MHSMLRGEKVAICEVERESDIKLYHGNYKIEKIGENKYRIIW